MFQSKAASPRHTHVARHSTIFCRWQMRASRFACGIMRSDAPTAFKTSTPITRGGFVEILPGSLVFAQALQSIPQPPLERRGRIGIESHEIPEGLAAIPAQP